ncbi:hypothetical protein EEL32_23950 [Brevibacillus laterosporus]|nr:hypothetical protein EEL32_23950 [Brevibacillus laterosporus]
MSCCGNHSNETVDHKKHSESAKPIKKHNWMMGLCCILPVILFVGVFLINTKLGVSTNFSLLGLLLLCPISHMIITTLINGRKRE